MKSNNSISKLLSIIIFMIGGISQSVSAQYDSIFHTPYPGRLHAMDSFMRNCYRDKPIDFKLADEEARILIQYAVQNRDINDQLNLKQQRLNSIYSWTLSRGMNYPDFIAEANQLLIESQKENLKVIEARMYSLIGQYYFSICNDYRLAFENLIKSKEIYQTLSSIEFPEKAYSYYVFAVLYYEFNDYESALRISKELANLEQIEYNKQLLNNDLMGECYVSLMKFDSARFCFEKVLELTNKSTYNKLAWTGIGNGKIGESWFYQNDFIKAEPLLLKGLDICMRPDISLWDNVNVFAAKLSKIYLDQGNLSVAYKFADISRISALQYDESGFVYKKLKSFKFHMNYYKALSDYHRVKSDYVEALKYQDSFLIYKDKIQQQVDVNQKYNAQIAIDNEKVKQMESIAIEESQRFSLIRNSLIGLVILLMIIFLLLYNWLIQRQKNKEQIFIAENRLKEKLLELELLSKNNEIKQRKQLELKNAIIEKSLKDKDVLIKEIHHRVKNNLQVISSLLDLQRNRLKDEVAIAAMEESKGRVMSIALIHQQLYQNENFRFIEIENFIKELVLQVNSSLKPNDTKIQVHYDLDPCFIHIDCAIPLGLILNELLTNSFKYAFTNSEKGNIEIQLKSKQQDIFSRNNSMASNECNISDFVYKDNGPGLPERMDILTTKTLGLKLVNQLSKQIGARISCYYENGLIFKFTF